MEGTVVGREAFRSELASPRGKQYRVCRRGCVWFAYCGVCRMVFSNRVVEGCWSWVDKHHPIYHRRAR